MLHYTRTGESITVPDDVCIHADLELAYRQMRLHRNCRTDLCAWKWVSYTTLIHHGHTAPPDSTPHREPDSATTDLPDPPPFREILDGLERLARDLRACSNGGDAIHDPRGRHGLTATPPTASYQ